MKKVKESILDLFKIPSTRGGRIRLLGLIAYSAVATAFPGVPQAVKLVLTTALSVINGGN